MSLPAALLTPDVHAAATAGSNDFTPMLPFELVEATEHHGPYITTAFGTTVCDFYAMSKPGWPSTASGGPSKPVLFTDAADHAAFMVRAANAHHDMLAALKRLTDYSRKPTQADRQAADDAIRMAEGGGE
jgi:hypothetical protein